MAAQSDAVGAQGGGGWERWPWAARRVASSGCNNLSSALLCQLEWDSREDGPHVKAEPCHMGPHWLGLISSRLRMLQL